MLHSWTWWNRRRREMWRTTRLTVSSIWSVSMPSDTSSTIRVARSLTRTLPTSSDWGEGPCSMSTISSCLAFLSMALVSSFLCTQVAFNCRPLSIPVLAASSSSIGSTTPHWVLACSTIVEPSQQEGLYRVLLPVARQTPNLEDQWLEPFQLSPQGTASVWNDASEPQ